MADEPLRDIIEAMRVRIEAELASQVKNLTARHDEALARARQEAAASADADAEKRWAAKLDATRAEWSTRLQSEVAVARADAEKRFVSEAMRARSDADKAAADA